jgi:hypothetical protein
MLHICTSCSSDADHKLQIAIFTFDCCEMLLYTNKYVLVVSMLVLVRDISRHKIFYLIEKAYRQNARRQEL